MGGQHAAQLVLVSEEVVRGNNLVHDGRPNTAVPYYREYERLAGEPQSRQVRVADRRIAFPRNFHHKHQVIFKLFLFLAGRHQQDIFGHRFLQQSVIDPRNYLPVQNDRVSGLRPVMFIVRHPDVITRPRPTDVCYAVRLRHQVGIFPGELWGSLLKPGKNNYNIVTIPLASWFFFVASSTMPNVFLFRLLTCPAVSLSK